MRRGPGRRFFIPSLQLFLRSFLAGRERQIAASGLRAEQHWPPARAPARFKSLLYIEVAGGKSSPHVMDSVLSLLNGDLSIWGVIAMPVGVAICFGPAVAVWLKEELRGEPNDRNEDGR